MQKYKSAYRDTIGYIQFCKHLDMKSNGHNASVFGNWCTKHIDPNTECDITQIITILYR